MPHSNMQVELDWQLNWYDVWEFGATFQFYIKLWMFETQRKGGAPHVPIEVIWADIQTRVGTPHKLGKCLRSGGGGTEHSIQVIWQDILTRALGWGHCIIFVDALGPGGWGHRTFYLRVPGQMFKLRRGYIKNSKTPWRYHRYSDEAPLRT